MQDRFPKSTFDSIIPGAYLLIPCCYQSIKVYQKKSTNVFHTGSSKSFQNASAPNHLEILQSPSIHTPRPRMAFRRWHRWLLLRSPAAPRGPHHGSNGAWDTSRCIEVSEASRGANRNWRSPGRYFWLVVSTPVKNTVLVSWDYYSQYMAK